MGLKVSEGSEESCKAERRKQNSEPQRDIKKQGIDYTPSFFGLMLDTMSESDSSSYNLTQLCP